jgi:hypothetical protein
MNRANLIGEKCNGNPIAPKCGPSHQFVMNPTMIQKELGTRNNDDDSGETGLRDGGAACGNANTGDDSRTNSDRLEPRVGYLGE